MLELLAPVGNMECLKAAINAGCDAVYLAGINFGARSFAENFNNDELLSAIKICHLYGVKVYVTINTIIYDSEVERFINYVDFLHKNNVDAVIMQDIGMIDLVRKTYPNLEIHMSTQGHIHNLEGVKLCSELGIKRVVLARETPIQLLENVKKNTNIDLEIFVHGALCMSYSGQCLMSYLIGGRSGNRGTCAQCCRQPYFLEINNKVVNNTNYLLSPKDLNTLYNIDKLINLGVTSLKIEGRMKRPEYVYLTVSIYRKAIDNYNKFGKTNISGKDILELKKMFNREFTKGFLFNEENDNFSNSYRPNHIGIKIGKVIDNKDKIVTIKLLDYLHLNDGIRIVGKNDVGLTVTNIYKNKKKIDLGTNNDIIELKVDEKVNIGDIVVKTTDYLQLQDINTKINIDKKVKIIGKFKALLDNKLELYLSDGKNEVILLSDYIVQKSINSKTTIDVIKNQLNKLGNSVYTFDKLEIITDNNIFIPINKLNEIRRNAIEELNNKRLYKTKYKKEEYYITLNDYPKIKSNNILVHNYDDYLKYKKDFNLIYIDNVSEYKKINDTKCILKLSRVNEYLKEYNQRLLIGELGSLYKYSNVDTDFSFNVVNSYSVAFLHSYGVNKITLSPELTYSQIKRLVKCYRERYKVHPNLEVIINSNVEAMICKYNLLNKYKVKEGFLIDMFNNKYKLKVDNGLMTIYDYKKTILKDDYFEIGINNVRTNI